MAIDIKDFIRSRMQELDTSVETRPGTPYGDLFINAQDFLMQPFVDQLGAMQTNQSLKKILALQDPDAYSEEPVDDFGSNLLVDRRLGQKARVTAKVFYSSPVDREFPPGTAQVVSQSGLNFFNVDPFSITQADMSLNREDSLYFFEVLVEAENEGDEYNIVEGDLVSLVGDIDVVRVTNENSPSTPGKARETNITFINRIKNSVAVRDLNVGKGINGILYQNFPDLMEIRPIGFKDPEMMRDILFNAHAGGYTDIYIKVPEFTVGEKEIIGLVFDSTRELETQTVMEVLATSLTDPEADIGNPFIVFGTLNVKETQPEAAATVDSVTIPLSGINLPNQNQYIKMQIDDRAPVNIKVAGAVPAVTSINEIVNSINAAIGFNVAKVIGQTKFRITSLKKGIESQIKFFVPDAPRDDATVDIFGFAAPDTISGFVPVQPVEGVDFQIDYENGKIIKLPSMGPTRILSGETIQGPQVDGIATTGSYILQAPFGGFISNGVSVGDDCVVTGGTGVTPGTYTVTQVIDDFNIRLDISFEVTAPSADVAFYIQSNKIYSINYKFNPLSVDIGNLVKLDDTGRTRGIRPGREDYTITDMAFIDLLTIEEIDPETREGLGVFLKNTEVGDSGYGLGGFGEGPYGIGNGAQFYLLVNSPHERFSAFEDSMLVFDPTLFGKSYRITYYYAPEVVDVHNFCRSESERLVDGDILVKHLLPAFVDTTINYTVDPTNTAVEDNDTITTNVNNFIQNVATQTRLEASDLIQFVEQANFIQVPFDLVARVIKPNGSMEVLRSPDFIVYPDVDLPMETDDPTTKRIVRFYPGNINMVRS